MKYFLTFTSLFIFLSFCNAQSLPEGFVYLDQVNSNIQVELRYYSKNNFVADTVDGYTSTRCIISLDAAKALSNIQQELESMGYGLKVFDAYRPQRAVDHFVRWAKNLEDTVNKQIYYPEVKKDQLFEKGFIATKSGHSRGSTVDLTLVYFDEDKKVQELDMGTRWDYFGAKSWGESQGVNKEQRANRIFLRDIMTKHGFKPLKEEWWHFTLRDEPFKSKYFNFEVK
ncbi:M15 family metallopeptidase [Sediminitomix flava]|uniref:D-alanyl-D-alanine dipeptidase n=1 Tax=Sediminitomix flava TaxID=379075 RepID=A0A315ZG42_SEDFL|nr:M15 family metallopeptidase [Sediminitomix flava]PWJ44123.1 D-Ala-D-Ala dipeptidase VanX [Sediminitomix flava]